MTMLTVEDELYRKAVDQIAFLQSAYENDRISAESFKVGVETVWNVLGGIVKLDDFQALMAIANREVLSLPSEPRIRVLAKGDNEVLIARSGERVAVRTAKVTRTREMAFDMEDEAVSYVRKAEAAARDKGFRPDA